MHDFYQNSKVVRLVFFLCVVQMENNRCNLVVDANDQNGATYDTTLFFQKRISLFDTYKFQFISNFFLRSNTMAMK